MPQKENRQNEGSKQITSKYNVAAEVLKPGFGAAKIFLFRGIRVAWWLMLVAKVDSLNFVFHCDLEDVHMVTEFLVLIMLTLE